MKTWAAIFLSAPVILGLVAWAVRPSRLPVATAVHVVSEPSPVPEERPALSQVIPPIEEDHRREVEREKARESLLAEYELRIQQLIASIDWTRADSRVRFPVEFDLIQADYDRSVERLQD